jgi:hypothetical protein
MLSHYAELAVQKATDHGMCQDIRTLDLALDEMLLQPEVSSSFFWGE